MNLPALLSFPSNFPMAFGVKRAVRLALAFVVPAALLLGTESNLRAEAPRISSSNEEVRRSMTLQLYGENLDAVERLHFWMPPYQAPPEREGRAGADDWSENAANPGVLNDPSPLPESPPEDAIRAREFLVQAPQLLAAACLVSQVPHASVFLVWLETGGEFSKPFVVNRPKAWWLEREQVSPGERLRVFGRNLTLQGRPLHTQTLALRCKDSGEFTLVHPRRFVPMGLGAEAEVAFRYAVQLEVPAELPLGSYEVFVHNGSGGDWGWSNPLSLDVQAPQPPVLDRVMVSEFGARGDGLHDDTDAIQAALQAAADSGRGAWVVFGPGVFSITKTLAMPPGVGILGAGKEATTIQVHGQLPLKKEAPEYFQRTFEDPGMEGWAMGYRNTHYTPMIIAGSGGRLHQLTLDPNGQAEWGVLVLPEEDRIEGFEAHRVRFLPSIPHSHRAYAANAERRGTRSGILFFAPSRNVRITECTLIGAELRSFRGPSEFWYVGSNTLLGVPTNYSTHIPGAPLGMTRSVLENNHSTYASRGLVFHGGASHNFVFNNVVEQTRGGGAGEPYLLEGSSSAYYGPIRNADDSSIEIEDIAPLEAHANNRLVVLIAKGRGFGQYRFVESIKGNTLHLAEPWTTVPDETTIVAISPYHTENILVANTDARANLSHYYGNSIGNVWASHRSFDSLGFSFHSDERGERGLTPVFFNDLLDSSFRGMRAMITLRGNNHLPNRFDVPTLVGNRIARLDVEGGPITLWERWTVLDGAAPWTRWQMGPDIGWRLAMEISPRQASLERPEGASSVVFNVVEDNAILYPEGPQILVTGGCTQNILRNNTLFDTRDPVHIEFLEENGAAQNAAD